MIKKDILCKVILLYKEDTMLIDERTWLTLLFDEYGKLLSEKQFDVLGKHLNLDISESEMAELENGSRQAIHDAITKAKKQLFDMEEKCGFVAFKQDLAKDLADVASLCSDKLAKEKLEKIITKF